MVEVIESNVYLIPLGKYTIEHFKSLLEEYRKSNTPSYPKATSSIIIDGLYIYLEKDDKLKVEGYKPLRI